MRLTNDLLQRSPVFMNPLNMREIDLRGNKLTQIENLGMTQVRQGVCRHVSLIFPFFFFFFFSFFFLSPFFSGSRTRAGRVRGDGSV